MAYMVHGRLRAGQREQPGRAVGAEVLKGHVGLARRASPAIYSSHHVDSYRDTVAPRVSSEVGPDASRVGGAGTLKRFQEQRTTAHTRPNAA